MSEAEQSFCDDVGKDASGKIFLTGRGDGEVVFAQEGVGEIRRVESGAVFASEDGDEMILATLQPPEVFGELALIDGGPRSASIQTLEPTTVLTLARATLLDLMSRPAVTDVVLRSLGRLVRRMIAQAGDLVFMDLQAGSPSYCSAWLMVYRRAHVTIFRLISR